MILTVTMNPAVDKVYEVEDFKVNKVHRPGNMISTAGGKGLNVSRVIKSLLGEVSATGLIGGSNGQYIKNELKKEEITNKFIDIQGNTRTCINIMDQKNNTSTEILESGPCIEEKEINDFLKKYEKIIQEYKIIIASGSLPRGLPDDFYQKLNYITQKNNRIFLLDTSGTYLKRGINSSPYMVKPNEDEIKQIFNLKDDKIASYVPNLIKLKEKGIELPVITLGKHGCITMIKNETFHFIPPNLKVKNTVGSGDAFMGGCGVGIYRNLDPVEIIKLGMACGIANTQFLKTGKITKDKVDEMKSKIKIKKIM